MLRERSWRNFKQVIDLRPVYHRKEERIRAHIILCWLALLLFRVAETTTGATWKTIADELALLTLGTFAGQAGTFRQAAELTSTRRDLLAKLTPRTRRRSSRLLGLADPVHLPGRQAAVRRAGHR